MKLARLQSLLIAAILVLGTVEAAIGAPIAAFDATPDPALPGQTVWFDGSASYDTDSARIIISWEWDFDDDGTYDYAGQIASVAFPVIGDYPITLRVTNDFPLAPQIDTTTRILRIRNDAQGAPEPGTLALMSLALVGLGAAGRRRH